MLGRKQSLKGDHILADYGPEECLNENADIEWVNKVCELQQKVFTFLNYIKLSLIILNSIIKTKKLLEN